VAVLPASAYPFVYAYANTKLPNWIDAHVKAYEYFGGVPKVTIPDNTKTAVKTPDLIDPVLNKTYYEMARHYRTTLIPARAADPRIKQLMKIWWAMYPEGSLHLLETDSSSVSMISIRLSKKNL
jgi:transposase